METQHYIYMDATIPLSPSALPFERVPSSMITNRLTTDSLMAFADTCGLFLCQQGNATLKVNNKNVLINPGDVFIYLPSTYVYVQDYSEDIQCIIYKTTLDFVLPMVGNSINIRNIITLTDEPAFSLKPEQRERLEKLIEVIDVRQRLLAELGNGDESLMLQIELRKLGEALVQEVFFCYFSSHAQQDATMDSRDKTVRTFIISLMDKHKRQREVKAYAQDQFLTPRYFSALIKEKTGRTAQQWIIQVVISSIKQALLYSTKSLKEIAAEYNFPTQSFFGKYFRQYTGMSPSDFRYQTGWP